MVRSHRAKKSRREAARAAGVSYTAQGRAIPCNSSGCGNTTRDASGFCHHHRSGSTQIASASEQMNSAPGLSTSSPRTHDRPAEKAYATSVSDGRSGRFSVPSNLDDSDRNFTWKADSSIPDEITIDDEDYGQMVLYNIEVDRDNHSVAADYRHENGATGNFRVFGIMQSYGGMMTDSVPNTPEVKGYDYDEAGADAVDALIYAVAEPGSK